MSDFRQFTAGIGAGDSLSGQVDIVDYTLIGLMVPAAWTAAALTFQVSPDGGTTWCELWNESASPVEVTSINTSGTTNVYVAVDPTALRGVRSLKIRSGTAGSPVDQTDAVSLTLIGRYVY